MDHLAPTEGHGVSRVATLQGIQCRPMVSLLCRLHIISLRLRRAGPWWSSESCHACGIFFPNQHTSWRRLSPRLRQAALSEVVLSRAPTHFPPSLLAGPSLAALFGCLLSVPPQLVHFFFSVVSPRPCFFFHPSCISFHVFPSVFFGLFDWLIRDRTHFFTPYLQRTRQGCETERRRNSGTSLNTMEECQSEEKMKERAKMVCSSFLKAAAAPHPAPHASPSEASAVSSRANVTNIFDGRCLKNNVVG